MRLVSRRLLRDRHFSANTDGSRVARVVVNPCVFRDFSPSATREVMGTPGSMLTIFVVEIEATAAFRRPLLATDIA
jgi:hypothetical protein